MDDKIRVKRMSAVRNSFSGKRHCRPSNLDTTAFARGRVLALACFWNHESLSSRKLLKIGWLAFRVPRLKTKARCHRRHLPLLSMTYHHTIPPIPAKPRFCTVRWDVHRDLHTFQ